MANQVDVCIIGGGIMGLFCALELSNNGKTVRIIDKLFTGSSRYNIGDALLQGHDETKLPFLKMAHDAWEAAEKDNDVDMGFEKRGSAFLAYNEQDAERFKAEVKDDNAHGFDSVVYEDDINKLCKFLGVSSLPDEVIGAKISSDDNIVDTGKALDALRQLLIKNGVLFWGSDEVSDFTTEGDKIVSVSTNTGETCIAKEYLITAGVWSNKLLQMVGVSIPMRPARCHLLQVSPNGTVPEKLIVKRFSTGDIIVKYQHSGQVLVSYTGAMDQAQATWNNAVDDEAVEWVVSQLPTMLKGLSSPVVNNISTITLAITQDGCPFIGKVGKYNNLTVAIGFSGKSYAYSAGVSKATDAIISGKDFEPDINLFKVDREIKPIETNLGKQEDVTMVVGDKPEADSDVTMVVGDKPEADKDISMELGDKPESKDEDVTMELGDKPEADSDVTMELGDKPEADSDVTMVVGDKPEADKDISMEVEGESALTNEKEEDDDSFKAEDGTSLGKKETKNDTKMTVEGGTALNADVTENESVFESDGAENTALGQKEQENTPSFVRDDEDATTNLDKAEPKTELVVEGETALTEKEENKTELVIEGEGSALGNKEEIKQAKGKLEVDENSNLGLGAKKQEDKPTENINKPVDETSSENTVEEPEKEYEEIEEEEESRLGLGAKNDKPKKAKGKLKVDETSNLGLGAKREPKKAKGTIVYD